MCTLFLLLLPVKLVAPEVDSTQYLFSQAWNMKWLLSDNGYFVACSLNSEKTLKLKQKYRRHYQPCVFLEIVK